MTYVCKKKLLLKGDAPLKRPRLIDAKNKSVSKNCLLCKNCLLSRLYMSCFFFVCTFDAANSGKCSPRVNAKLSTCNIVFELTAECCVDTFTSSKLDFTRDNSDIFLKDMESI